MVTFVTFASKPTGESTKTVSINGSVLDNNNFEGLIGASIYIEETGETIYTDFDGNFSLENIPAGDYTFKISMISYQEVVINNITISENMELNMTLHPH